MTLASNSPTYPTQTNQKCYNRITQKLNYYALKGLKGITVFAHIATIQASLGITRITDTLRYV